MFGGALFERHRSGLKPIELAISMLENGDAVEASILSMHELLTSIDHEPARTVRIAMMEGIGSLYLARCLKPFLQQYTKMKLELITSSQLVDINRREAETFLNFFKPFWRSLNGSCASLSR
jgi:DNA-binding transcriptional LysR family regulator